MTKIEFKELKYIKKEIEMLKEEIKELHNTLKSPELGVTAQKCGVSDTVARMTELIIKKEKLLNDALLRCVEQENRMLSAISEVSDSRMRQILKYKFVDGLSWVQIGHKMGVSAECIKMAFIRWEKGEGKKEE